MGVVYRAQQVALGRTVALKVIAPELLDDVVRRTHHAVTGNITPVMRIWDLDPASLCDRHLLGEHRELHAIWSILTTGKRGYRAHPETMRWRGRLAALYARHDAQVAEMRRRGFNHASPLDPRHATGSARQTEFVDSVEAQRERLAQHACACFAMASR